MPVKLLQPRKFSDSRGWFSESYNAAKLRRHGIAHDFVQDNHSSSAQAGTIRGLHFQLPPFDQTKLVRCVCGAIWDVAIDLRKDSPTWAKAVSATLSAENQLQLLVPKGFAHGFVTLEPDTEVIYKVDAPYSADHDSGIAWNDAQIGLDWPVAADQIVLSEKDQNNGPLSQFDSPFPYDGVPLPKEPEMISL